MPNKYLDSVGLAEYTGLVKTALSGKAPSDSPALTGTPTAPTPTAGDDSTKIATTEFVQDEVANYLPLSGGSVTGNLSVSGTITGDVTGTASGNLPLSGGTMTGNVVFDMSEGRVQISANQNEAGRLRLLGGTGITNGAQLLLSGKSHSSTAGQFQLGTHDGTNSASLIGKPDGTLTWGGKTVIVGTEATETFNIASINAGSQTSFSLAQTPRYYSVSMSGTGFAGMLVTKGGGNKIFVVNTGSLNRTNITVTVKYIY